MSNKIDFEEREDEWYGNFIVVKKNFDLELLVSVPEDGATPEDWKRAKLYANAPLLLEKLTAIIEIGKRDMSNPKYDSYFDEAKELIKSLSE